MRSRSDTDNSPRVVSQKGDSIFHNTVTMEGNVKLLSLSFTSKIFKFTNILQRCPIKNISCAQKTVPT